MVDVDTRLFSVNWKNTGTQNYVVLRATILWFNYSSDNDSYLVQLQKLAVFRIIYLKILLGGNASITKQKG